MKKIIKRTAVIPNFLGQPSYYFEEKGTGRKFRRIVGGMGWPIINPGALIIIGEDLTIDPALDERKILVLAEYENRDLSEVITRCGELKRFLSVEKFYTDITDGAMMKESLKYRTEAQISLSKAPLVDEPTADVTYLNRIYKKTSANKKLLFFKKESALPRILSSLPKTKPTDLRSEYPKIAALGYALSALALCPYKKPRAPGVSYQPLDPITGY